MKIRNLLILCSYAIGGLAGLNSCDDFLDEPTSKTNNIEIKSVDQIEALFGNVTNFYQETSGTSCYSTDDYALKKDMYDASSKAYSIAAVQFATWDIETVKTNSLNNDWRKEYQKIFYANMVLNDIGKLSGSKEQKEELTAEAHLIRAYAYISLSNTYCLPYCEKNKQEMGLPLKQAVDFEEVSSRSTLEETHALIVKDLEAAAAIKRKLKNGERTRSWRASSGAVNAVSARYWLMRNDYAKALEFAERALTEYNELVDYNTDMHFWPAPFKSTVTHANGTKETVEIHYPYTVYEGGLWSLSEATIDWKEFYYFRLLENSASWHIPSRELLDLYEENPGDLRYKYHIVPHYSYYKGLRNPAYDYPGYLFFYYNRIPSGPTVGEMYLIKAECLARQNYISEAMEALNTLRTKRFDSSTYIAETASSKEEAIHKILNERRRELPFSARWTDCRRYNTNDDPNDDVEYQRVFYPYTSSGVLAGETPVKYTLTKDSRRWASPLPQDDIDSSNGDLKQNEY